MKRFMPAIVAGFGAGVLHVVPLTKALTCCLVIPIAAFIALVLEQKSSELKGDIELGRGMMLGFMTGLFAALFGSFFDIFITFITKNNDIITAYHEMSEIFDSFPVPQEVKEETMNLMRGVVESIKESGFSFIYSITILINNIIVDSLFGFIGGIIGTKILNARNTE